MKVETWPIEQRPDVRITLSWEEAQVLATVCGGIAGPGIGKPPGGQKFTQGLYSKLSDLGLRSQFAFEGHFK